MQRLSVSMHESICVCPCIDSECVHASTPCVRVPVHTRRPCCPISHARTRRMGSVPHVASSLAQLVWEAVVGGQRSVRVCVCGGRSA